MGFWKIQIFMCLVHYLSLRSRIFWFVCVYGLIYTQFTSG